MERKTMQKKGAQTMFLANINNFVCYARFRPKEGGKKVTKDNIVVKEVMKKKSQYFFT
jgi:hypothetical protein